MQKILVLCLSVCISCIITIVHYIISTDGMLTVNSKAPKTNMQKTLFRDTEHEDDEAHLISPEFRASGVRWYILLLTGYMGMVQVKLLITILASAHCHHCHLCSRWCGWGGVPCPSP